VESIHLCRLFIPQDLRFYVMSSSAFGDVVEIGQPVMVVMRLDFMAVIYHILFDIASKGPGEFIDRPTFCATSRASGF
jgi:hypothetical protein